MSRVLTPLVAAALTLTATPLAAAPADAVPSANARSYKNCTELNRDYPAGVGRRGAKDKTPGTPVRNFKVDNALYNKVAGKMDRDRDGIACEKLTKGNPTTRTNRTTKPTANKRKAPKKTPKAPVVKTTPKKTTAPKKSTGRTVVTSGAMAFTTPSSNITCKTFKDVLFCSIEERTYRSTQRPASCRQRWGNVFYLYVRGGFLCSDVSLYGQAPASSAWFAQTKLKPLKSPYGPQAVLPYGWTLRSGGFTCKSETSGVTCTDASSKRGWTISKTKYRIF